MLYFQHSLQLLPILSLCYCYTYLYTSITTCWAYLVLLVCVFFRTNCWACSGCYGHTCRVHLILDNQLWDSSLGKTNCSILVSHELSAAPHLGLWDFLIHVDTLAVVIQVLSRQPAMLSRFHGWRFPAHPVLFVWNVTYIHKTVQIVRM